ncbi:MAG: hypothetical protein ACD_24C00022G0005 [uncultured bacterium]|uniref:Prepilin-type N-terminal cleavage/methylation domain-containing protein n=1 Tax=candidate division WWE3 bacterium RBG_16_37_10 TaxID=1802610 RepID=A0A1F4V595_UNCKA|nr:MAG: hypothetical protein ACD_24C00022G0005 [uncultured bacterium]OGC51733.1 MAG: hypothetical protein A2W32_02795 [candidate division WWE3 bacterium RBG_16_37_10]
MKNTKTFYLERKKITEEGFTLIELILYLGLIAILLSGIIFFTWNVILGGTKSNIQLLVNQNIRFASKRISYEIRNALSINSLSANELCLASSDTVRNPTRIYTNGNDLRIAWGGGSTNCTGMTTDQLLTSSGLVSSDISFNDRSTIGTSQNVEYTLTVSSNSDRQEWQHSRVYTETVEIRTDQ